MDDPRRKEGYLLGSSFFDKFGKLVYLELEIR